MNQGAGTLKQVGLTSSQEPPGAQNELSVHNPQGGEAHLPLATCRQSPQGTPSPSVLGPRTPGHGEQGSAWGKDGAICLIQHSW